MYRSGKTLAFLLPVVEALMEGPGRLMRGRKPRCLILSPTRELAVQTASEATSLAPDLAVLSVYGGTAYDPQINGLRSGTDMVIGTPGR